jgi:serine/threonine-protein kinase
MSDALPILVARVAEVYACGVMLFELTTGRVPFVGRDTASILDQQVNAPPPLVSTWRPDVDPRPEEIIQRAFAKSREDRHASM